MRLAKLCGLNVAAVELKQVLNRSVLLIERFDRVASPEGWQRKLMVSVLTILEENEMMARCASYTTLAQIICHRFTHVKQILEELFQRIIFNILVGNTDDHARNHAAFWDGEMLTLTPAYDICPQARTGNEASQAMLITHNNRMSRISVCLDAAPIFYLDNRAAMNIVMSQIMIIGLEWLSVCAEANLSEIERRAMFGRQFFNSFAFDDLSGDRLQIKNLAESFLQRHR